MIIQSPKNLAIEGCQEGFQDKVQEMTAILLGNWAGATTPAKQAELIRQFQNGLETFKGVYDRAQQVIATVFP